MTEGIAFWIVGLVVAAVPPQFIQSVPERRRLAISGALLVVAGEVALWAFAPIAVAAWVNVIAVLGLIPLVLFWADAPEIGSTDSRTTPETQGPEPHDPTKDYSARPEHQVRWQGRFRYIRGSLHDVGNGWDRGVWLEVELPSGEVRRIHEWQDLSGRPMRREVEKGDGVSAEPGGDYIFRWRSVSVPPYESEVVAEETITLDPTGPLADWIADHRGLEARFALQVRHMNGDQGSPLQGFRCSVSGPEGVFEADDRDRESQMGIIQRGEFPTPKTKGEFFFPEDFTGAPATRDLRDGRYTVYWTAWEPDPNGEWLEHEWIDVARDAFEVTRNGQII